MKHVGVFLLLCLLLQVIIPLCLPQVGIVPPASAVSYVWVECCYDGGPLHLGCCALMWLEIEWEDGGVPPW
jgi:hypothetical protein